MMSSEHNIQSPLTEEERRRIINKANNSFTTLEGLIGLMNKLQFERYSDVMSKESHWKPDVKLSDGSLAKDKAMQLMERRGTQVSSRGAIQRIMLENHKEFDLPLPSHWNAEMLPGGVRAIERAIYLIEREDFLAQNAVECVMFEYSHDFFEDVPVQWTNVDNQTRHTAHKMGKNRIKNSRIDAMSCIKSIMVELPNAFDPDINVSGDVPDQLVDGSGQTSNVVLDIENFDPSHTLLTMSLEDVLTFADLSLDDQMTWTKEGFISVASGMSLASFNKSIQMKQQVEGTKPASGNNNVPRETQEKKLVKIFSEEGVLLVICKDKAEAGRYMFGKGKNPGKRVDYALRNSQGLIYDRKQGQKKGHQILFRVCLAESLLS